MPELTEQEWSETKEALREASETRRKNGDDEGADSLDRIWNRIMEQQRGKKA